MYGREGGHVGWHKRYPANVVTRLESLKKLFFFSNLVAPYHYYMLYLLNKWQVIPQNEWLMVVFARPFVPWVNLRL